MANMRVSGEPEVLTELLRRAGFVAAKEEASELLACACGDAERLASLVTRRIAGEPLAWITGGVLFCNMTIRVEPGVYVPRWQSEPLARRAAERLPATGGAVEVCTGSGALAKVLAAAQPRARVVACDLDDRAVACAVANGVEAYVGDLFAPVPAGLEGRVDVVVGVVPYVPTSALALLPRDTLAFESPLSYDGGPDGIDVLRRAAVESPHYLRPGGALMLELGGDQAEVLGDVLDRLGFVDLSVFVDQDGDERGIEATFGATAVVNRG